MGFSDLISTADRSAQKALGAITVTYEPFLGDPVELKGIFDERYKLLDATHAGVETVTPALWVKLEDLPENPRLGERGHVVVNGKRYSIRERQVDNVGSSVLLLLRTAKP